MSTPLRILHLEDEPDFAELVRSILEKEGWTAKIELAGTLAEFEAALARETFDIILADYSLPTCNGLEALAVARRQSPTTPFLLVSGTIGEQAAIESLKAGATDYVLKLFPERLAPAVRRAVQEAEELKQHRQAEAELVRREKYFRALTENALDILTILNREGLYVYNSPSVTRVLGYDPKELVGKSPFALMPPEDQPRVWQAFERALADPQRTERLEFRFRHKDGSWRYLEAVGQNRLDDPDIGGVVVNSRDVSDRRQAEAALRSSQMLFHSVWENSVDGMGLTDENGTIVAVNDAFCRLVGLARAQLEGQPFTVIYAPGENPEQLLEKYTRQFRERVTEHAAERRITLRNGQMVTLERTTSFAEIRGGRSLLLGLFRDVTEQKRLEDQLRQAQKMEAIGQLAGGVAHDFNNILTVIHGHASLLLAAGNGNRDSARSAQQIAQAAERAAGLTRQLLTFSRHQVMQPRRVDMNELVGNMTKMLGRILGEHITLQLHYFGPVAPVQADAGMMEQVLLNLVLNARDAMPKGGLLTLKVSVGEVEARHTIQHPEAHPGRYVCLIVRDSGCGIPPQHLGRIFEPFFTTKEVGKGTGLGLATVYGIVKQHQGWVEVESPPGRGAEFRVFLPYCSQAPELGDMPATERTVRGGTETILVVEDEAPVRELVCNLLAGYGYTVVPAESAVEALTLWRDRGKEVDLVLTDLVMPDRVNGRELAERLWAERPTLKVIFTSGYSADVVGKDFAMRRGLNYLQKPYHPRKLALAVRDCLDAVN